MRILTITNCPLDPRLGSGTTVIRFTEGLRQLGHEVEVLAPTDYEAWPRARVAKQFRQGLGALRAVRDRLAHRSYDVIEFYGAEFWPAIVDVARSKKRPLLVAHTNGLELLNYERERDYDPPRGMKTAASRAIHRTLFVRSFRHTDAFVALCEADREWVIAHGLYSRSMTAVVPPAPGDTFQDVAAQTLAAKEDRVCYTGSWTARKGIDHIAAVMNQVLRDNPKVVFDVFGASPDRPLVISAFDAAVRARVVVHPGMDPAALAAAIARGKVFFFPSQYEGYGLALLEAMACGLAVVTTPTGLGGELDHEREAIVCSFGDREAMRTAIEGLLKDEPRRAVLAANGQNRARELHWQESVSQLSQQYTAWVDALIRVTGEGSSVRGA